MKSKCLLIFFLLHAPLSINSVHIDSIETSAELFDSFAPHSFSSGVSSSTDIQASGDRKRFDYYEYRHIVADGVQKTLAACRDKFKWDRWNCPKQAFLDILRRHSTPSNKELGFTRALIASGIVLSLTRSCSYGTSSLCNCNPPIAATTELPIENNPDVHITHEEHHNNLYRSPADTNQLPSPMAYMEHEANQILSKNDTDDGNRKTSKFAWNGCDESVKFAFKVSKTYLESQDVDMNQDEASRRINAHNYEVGRLAVKKSLQKMCKCHGVSGTCQIQTCWTTVPDMRIVVDYLKRRFRLAAKVGAMTAVDSDIISLNKELTAISKDRIVFADASPDYCYENTSLGINGTLGRYCSRAKQKANSTEPVSRYERDSCDRLCTECGYKIKREVIKMEKQCQCQFFFCCSVQCKRCPHEEEAFKCVRHI